MIDRRMLLTFKITRSLFCLVYQQFIGYITRSSKIQADNAFA